MYRPHVDPPQTISACAKADDREVHYCMPIKFGQELGQRTWCVQLVCLGLSVSYSLLVKWLGPDAISALAIDGKGGKAEMLERVARWVAAGGRNVSQPGTNTHFTHVHSKPTFAYSDDRVLRDAPHLDGPPQQLQDRTAAL